MTKRMLVVIYAAMLGQTLIAAGTFLTGKRALEEIAPGNLVTARLFISAAIFVLLLLVIEPKKALPPFDKIKTIFFLGLLAGPLNQGLFMVGLFRTFPSHSALIYALTPLMVFLIQVFKGRERVLPVRIVGIGLAFSGVLVLLLGQGIGDGLAPAIGDLLIVGAVVAWATYTTEGKALTETHGPFRALGWTMIAGAIWMIPLSPFTFSVADLAASSQTAWLCLVYLALLTSVVSYLFWYYALSKIDASKVAVFTNLQPLFTALLAWMIFAHPLSWEIWVGGVLILLGVRLCQRSRFPLATKGDRSPRKGLPRTV